MSLFLRFCLLLKGDSDILTCLPVDIVLLQELAGSEDDFIVLTNFISFGIIVCHVDEPLLILQTLLVGVHHLLHELLTLLAQGELRFHLRVADHHVTVPMATA